MAYSEQRILLLVDALRLFQAHISAMHKAAGIGAARRQGVGQERPGLDTHKTGDDGRRPVVIPRDDGTGAALAPGFKDKVRR